MDSNSQQQSGTPSSGPTPFKPPSPGSISDVVEASGTARPGEIVSTCEANTGLNRNSIGRPLPTRPWEQQTYGSIYGGSDGRRCELFWSHFNFDRSEHPSISHVYVCSSAGLLYGELARLVLRLLGIEAKPRKVERPRPDGLPAPPQSPWESELH